MRQIDTPRGPVAIRTPCEADLAALRALRIEALTAHPTAFGSSPVEIDNQKWAELAKGTLPDNGFYVAAAGEQLIGLTGIYRDKQLKERHRAGIWSVYVREQWRGHGIGEALLDAAVEWAAERGVSIIHLMVTTTNTAAIACYHRCGFRISGVEHATIKVGDTCYDEFLMYRWINR